MLFCTFTIIIVFVIFKMIMMNDIAKNVATDRHTHTQNDYRNPLAHARRGLKMCSSQFTLLPHVREFARPESLHLLVFRVA